MENDRENPREENSGLFKWIEKTMETAGRMGIQFTVLVSFTVVSVFIMVLLGFSLYQRFTLRTRAMMTESMEQLMSQTEANFEDYLTSMRRVSDAMYYDTIKDKDMTLDSLDSEMSLLYEANKDNLISFALFKRDGSLVCAAPVSTMKEGMDVRLQPWFKMAMERPENLHFSTPHVQNVPVRGVLLVDMNYNTIKEMMDRVNRSNSYQYFYLCDSNGELIYHPRMNQIGVENYKENNLSAADYEDGLHEEIFEGERRMVVVKTISYTGWKLVGVIPMSGFRLGTVSTQLFTFLVLLVTILALLLINRLVTNRITSPILRLNRSIQNMDGGRTEAGSIRTRFTSADLRK